MRLTPQKKTPLLLAILAFVLSLASLAAADGFVPTGSGIRVKKILFASVNVYSLSHSMASVPKAATKGEMRAAIIQADVDKRYDLRLMRDVGEDKIKDAIKEAYANNGYGDQAKIGQFMALLNRELKEGTHIGIAYSAAAKTTTISVTIPDKGGKPYSASATISGADFMKGTWSIWLGKFDQPSLSDELVSKAPLG